MQYRDPVRHLGKLVQVLGHEHDAGAGRAEGEYQLVHPAGGRDIEAARRVRQHVDLRVRAERLR